MQFSIIIPVVGINDYVMETVEHILALDCADWELLIVTNNSEECSWHDSRIKVISSGRVGPGRKRDIGSKCASGSILVFLDDDSYPARNLLDVANLYLKKDNVIALGGPGITPDTDKFWQKVSGATFLTVVTGGVSERYISKGTVKKIDDWPSVNFIVKKSAFDSVNGFNTDFWPGEDSELCKKLNALDGDILYVPSLVVYHHRRSGFFKHIKQVSAYGLHRGYLAKSGSANSRNVKYTIPSLLIFSIIFFLILGFVDPIGLMLVNYIFIAYLIIILIGAYQMCKQTNLNIGICAIPYVIATHVAYGISYINGLFKKQLVSKLR